MYNIIQHILLDILNNHVMNLSKKRQTLNIKVVLNYSECILNSSDFIFVCTGSFNYYYNLNGEIYG